MRNSAATARSDRPPILKRAGPHAEIGPCLDASAFAANVLLQPGAVQERRAVGDAHPREGISMAQRPIDRLAKRLLELRLPTDVVPAHAWHLERQFAQSARFYQLQRALYVGPPDGLARQARCVFAGRRRVDRARECGERGVTVQRGEVGADKTRGARSEFVEPRAGEGVRCGEQRDGTERR